ncbi:MAG TPA: hypothetical protein VGO00_14445 [Kofleriaceae bacterium]|nr:hypothetical protein [Kofleriaceae bacterium]
MKLAVCVVLAQASLAFADDEPEPVAPYVAGSVETRAALEVSDAITSIAVDGFYAVNERFRIGATTSHAARRQLGAGRGLCVVHCLDRFEGVAADAEVRLGPSFVGRAAIDAVRFAPTAVAAEIGGELHAIDGRIAVVVSPTLRIGVARRDLANGDGASLPAEIDLRLGERVGISGIARVAVAFDQLDARPSFGSAGGVWLVLGPVKLTARSGSTDVFHLRSTLFADLAIAWSS